MYTNGFTYLLLNDGFLLQVIGMRQPMWPDLAKFRHFGKSLKVFGTVLMVYFLFGKMLSVLWQICDIIFIVANDQIWKII